jgi:hypothetical protein
MVFPWPRPIKFSQSSGCNWRDGKKEKEIICIPSPQAVCFFFKSSITCSTFNWLVTIIVYYRHQPWCVNIIRHQLSTTSKVSRRRYVCAFLLRCKVAATKKNKEKRKAFISHPYKFNRKKSLRRTKKN